MKRHGTGTLHDDAEVSRAVVLNHSEARDHVLLTAGEFTVCTLSGSMKTAGWPIAINSQLSCDLLAGTPVIMDSFLGFGVRVYDNPQITNCALNGLIAVYGDAVLQGWNLSLDSPDYLRIHAGVWTRPPRHIQVGRYLISECRSGFTHCGCYCKANSWWLSHYRLGTRLGVDPAPIKQFILACESGAAIPASSAPSIIQQPASA